MFSLAGFFVSALAEAPLKNLFFRPS